MLDSKTPETTKLRMSQGTQESLGEMAHAAVNAQARVERICTQIAELETERDKLEEARKAALAPIPAAMFLAPQPSDSARSQSSILVMHGAQAYRIEVETAFGAHVATVTEHNAEEIGVRITTTESDG